MFSSRHNAGSGGSANRWLIVAGAGLVILAFVARMLLDIGHTKVSDLTGALTADTAAAAPAPAPAPSDPTVVATSDTASPPPPAPSAPAAVARPGPGTSPTSVPTPTAPAAAAVKADTPPASGLPPGVAIVKDPRPPILLPDSQWKGTMPGGRGYAVQVGAFGSRENADKLAARASALGFGAGVSSESRNGGVLYLVRVTGLRGADEARTAADSLTRALKVNAVVIPPGH